MRISSWLQREEDQPLSERKRAAIWAFLAVMIFVVASAVSDPLPSQAEAVPVVAPTETTTVVRPTATQGFVVMETAAVTETVLPTPTKTPLPDFLLENYDDTNGIVVGTVMLVVIILLGTISGIRVRRSQN